MTLFRRRIAFVAGVFLMGCLGGIVTAHHALSQTTSPKNLQSRPAPAKAAPAAARRTGPVVRPAASPAAPQAQAVEVPVTLLYTTDLEGQLRRFVCRKKKPGEDKVSKATKPTKKQAQKKQVKLPPPAMDMANLLWQVQAVRRELIRKRMPSHLLFNTGDNLAPQQEARFLLEFEGIAGVDFIADVMKQFQYDLIGLGNHEFSVSTGRMRAFLQRARLKGLQFSAANIVRVAPTHPLSGLINRDSNSITRRDYFVYPVSYRGATVRVGVFHLVPEKLRVSRKKLIGLTIVDPYEYAKKLVAQMKKEQPAIDLVVVLSHLESSSSKGSKVEALAQQVPGIDVIITNEMHQAEKILQQKIFINKDTGKRVYIVAGTQHGTMLGRINLRLRKAPGVPAQVQFVDIQSIPLQPWQFNYSLRRKLKMWEQSYCIYWGQKLGQGNIRKDASMSREGFTSYTVNLMRELSHAEVAIINKGLLRQAPFPIKHYLTKDDVFRAMPFNSRLVVMTLQGRDLSAWISALSDQESLAFAGYEDGNVNGRELDARKYYRVVMIDYLLRIRRTPLVQKIQEVEFQIQKVRQKLKDTPNLMLKLMEESDISAKAKKQLEGLRRSWPTTKKELRQEIIALQKKLATRRKELRRFDQTWQYLTYRGCSFDQTRAGQCPASCCPQLRTVMLQHFQNNAFRQLPRSRPDSDEPYFKPSEIPHTGTFVDLHERFGWSFDAKLNVRFDANLIAPDNLTGPLSYARIPSDFYSQYLVAGELELTILAGTKTHRWQTTGTINYGAYVRSQWNPDQQPPGPTDVFDESSDEVILTTQYQYSRWKRFKPLVLATLQTEITRRGRPNLSDIEYVKKLSEHRYRIFSVVARVGFDFDAVVNKLILFLTLNYKQQFALQIYPEPGSAEALLYPGLGGLPDTNAQPGFSAGYRTTTLTLFELGRRKITFTSQAQYSLHISIAPPFIKDQPVLVTHDIDLQNAIAFDITEYIALKFGLRTIFYKGTLQRSFASGSIQYAQFYRVEGPWAFWVVPSVAISLRWGTRGQVY